MVESSASPTPFEMPPRRAFAQLPTPLQPLERLSSQLGGPRLWVKRDDLTGSLLSGNKVRKLEFVLAQALAEGCDTLITCGGLQSNHCRATALLGAQLGLKVHLVLRGLRRSGVVDGNLLLSQLAGAQVHCLAPARYALERDERMAAIARETEAKGGKAWVIPTGASDAWGLWGYINASAELAEDYRAAGFRPDAVICATGSGGTHAGLTLGHQVYCPDVPVLGMAVCDDRKYFQRRYREDVEAWEARFTPATPDGGWRDPEINDAYIGPGYGLAEPEVFDTIALLARTEGLVLDPVYTGKAFHGLLQELKAGRFGGAEHLVFVHTGGVFGLFPQREQLADALGWWRR
ncbi:D-cysteine desulfhydrase family protein [Marinimicrobium alkaliphilum]|uniref:D-cysteine desulfhydrase family protein n=1 Tax=Marinimicrobium alkaliphilum TaxID=2202654 RepID=UPI001E65D818|nr:D-cysteine desulfhydrase family protein [Marinimicrobium alkaliphilum]